ncbi:hypothetical protein J7I80_11655 [Bacillus sp. ISL-41]|uniref:hypothetical protein n=1 Tax=Bacillus sp. ISL-41 TaxID=2819127 RepID=UPI001BEC78F4|nr:hypothetical protein [Bacillus sp. ISL-41]MBT2642884.1 hypothetical protein [Bacillus sp. ISL-41]
MDLKQIQKTIDWALKNIWVDKISKDYKSFYLLKEDTLKNALYYHLRNELASLFDQHNLRIYTEFHHGGFKADLAIVKLNDDPGNNDHLKDDIENVLAIIELKYKSCSTMKFFEEDVVKIKNYIDATPSATTQYYLAFIHEAEYEYIEDDSWLTLEQQVWAKDRLTELSGHYIDGKMKWTVLSYNGMNKNYRWEYRFTKDELTQAASFFNEKKYSHEFYNHFLGVVSREKEVTQELRDAVRYLMYWKLGKVSSKQQPTSEVVVVEGNTYYVSGTTTQNRLAIEKSLVEDLLEMGLKFRNQEITYEQFKDEVDSITGTSIVLPAFYIHIWQPADFPILDIKVWRTYKWNKGEVVLKHTKPTSWRHYEEYISFFNGLVADVDKEWRDCDKGLWMLGEKLKVGI